MEAVFPSIIIFSFIFSTIGLVFSVGKVKHLIGIYNIKHVIGIFSILTFILVLSLFFLHKISTM